MDFGAYKRPFKVIKDSVFGGTFLRCIYFGINGKWYRKSRKEFGELKNIDRNFYFSKYYVVSVNKCGVKCGTSLRFEKIRGESIL